MLILIVILGGLYINEVLALKTENVQVNDSDSGFTEPLYDITNYTTGNSAPSSSSKYLEITDNSPNSYTGSGNGYSGNSGTSYTGSSSGTSYTGSGSGTSRTDNPPPPEPVVNLETPQQPVMENETQPEENQTQTQKNETQNNTPDIAKENVVKSLSKKDP